ncbi:MAG: aminotransferase [Micavibrio aeruginosavorus]|uniref:Aminotransferase n=1 Tax=Micavibrio aeruginosavorus TaxID=349221 RepID=A0A7T5R478_9BACT|nr:MAG: aminotransferase [Micavibrio aeruginosavorus]
MKPVSVFYNNQPTTIFATMSALAAKHGAINLGQGFPDTDGPEWVRKAAADVLIKGPNQYPPMPGHPDLRKAVAEHNKRFYNLDIDPMTETLVTAGATEALSACCMGLLNPGDEAIVIEPYYDSYVPQIIAAGGTPKFVRLAPPDWALSEQALRAAFGPRTKLIILNSPMNPAGKVFSRSELGIIASLLMEFDAYAICDEVYEHLVFAPHEHIPLMTLPGMRDRCLRIGSAGKTFSMTGWKIGYVTGCAPLIKPVTSAHQYLTFTVNPATQIAVAQGLRADDSYFAGLVKGMDEGRQILNPGLAALGFEVLPCNGTYFLTVDVTNVAKRAGFTGSDLDFAVWLNEKAKVTVIPMSAFYHPNGGPAPHHLARFCFAKKREVLEGALDRLREFL